MNKVSKLAGVLLIAIPFGLACTATYAESYYRWKDENGQIHYGSRPPIGVDAEKVKTYGGRTTTEESSPATAGAASGPEATEETNTQKIAAERKQQCDQERQRLATLKSTSRIRMQNDDGSTRYLTPEEVSKEMSMSQDFLNNACK